MDTVDKFWDTFNNGNVLSNYDYFIEIFSDLPQELAVDEELDYVITDIATDLFNEKEFAKFFEFKDLIKEKLPSRYATSYPVIEDVSIDYHCFKGEKEKIRESVAFFANDPLVDYDVLLQSFKMLLCYGHKEQINLLIEKAYFLVIDNDDYISGTGQFLAKTKFNLTLEDLYKKADGRELDIAKFREAMRPYSFEITDEIGELLINALYFQGNSLDEEIQELYHKKRVRLFNWLSIAFFRYMYDRGMPFSTSDYIWTAMLLFWAKRKASKKLSSYFVLDDKRFEKYLTQNIGIFTENVISLYSTLWGSTYVYDFLKSVGLVDDRIYNKFKASNMRLKGIVLKNNKTNIWVFSFVHQWPKPDSITQEEFDNEASSFKETFDRRPEKRELKMEQTISEAFTKVAEEYVRKIKAAPKREREYQTERTIQPKIIHAGEGIYKSAAKIGRNEKVKVKYQDGTIKNGIKYKKVQEDVEKGVCVLM